MTRRVYIDQSVLRISRPGNDAGDYSQRNNPNHMAFASDGYNASRAIETGQVNGIGGSSFSRSYSEPPIVMAVTLHANQQTLWDGYHHVPRQQFGGPFHLGTPFTAVISNDGLYFAKPIDRFVIENHNIEGFAYTVLLESII